MSNWLQRFVGETQVEMLRLLRRSRQTITSLADALRLTDNAVRTHVAALEREGVVEHVGTQRDTGGKPARIYDLTSEGEELFPKAYALVLGGLVEEIARSEGEGRAVELLRAVGRRVGAGVPASDGTEARAKAAAAALRSLGGDLEVTASRRRVAAQGLRLPAVRRHGRTPGGLRAGPGAGGGDHRPAGDRVLRPRGPAAVRVPGGGAVIVGPRCCCGTSACSC